MLVEQAWTERDNCKLAQRGLPSSCYGARFDTRCRQFSGTSGRLLCGNSDANWRICSAETAMGVLMTSQVTPSPHVPA